MRRSGLLIAATLCLLCGTQAAYARKAQTETDTFTAASGLWNKGRNWSLGKPPTRTTPVVIPAGREATISRPRAQSASLTVRGRLAGPQGMTVWGSLSVEGGGEFDLDESVTITGLGHIDFGGEEPYYLRLKGWHTLTGPLTVANDLDIEPEASLNTAGYEVVVPRESYGFLGSTTLMGSSTWRTGEWFFYGPGQAVVEPEQATVIIDRPVLSEDESFFNTFFDGVGWTYGNVTLEGYEPRTYQGFAVAGTLMLNRSVGGVRLEAGRTVEFGRLASDGTEAEPARVQSTEAGVGYVLKIPHDETIDGCLAISDAHVEGGTLTDPCADGDEGGNSGIVF